MRFTGPAYDYIVVGSGAGGGPLAANLAKAGFRVLLLEAGGTYEGLTYEVPSFHGLATEDEAMRWDFFVRHYTDDARQARDSKFKAERDGVLYPRAATLGGCTSHNAMITVYPHNHDWDAIAKATRDASWRAGRMRRYFERLEHCRYRRRPRRYPTNPLFAALVRFLRLSRLFRNQSRHGFSGWLQTSFADPKLAISDFRLLKVIFAAAAQTFEEDLGRPLNLVESLLDGDLWGSVDPNDWRYISHQGLWLIPLATDGVRRNGSREYVLAVRQTFPERLDVKTNALATRVIFDEPNRAVGVEYLEGEHVYAADPRAGVPGGGGLSKEVLAEREVILAAGAFNTPQLLKLSGIGPRDELRALGLKVRVDLPGVGENLQDRYEVGVINEMIDDFGILEDCKFDPSSSASTDPCLAQWQQGSGVYRTNGAVLGIIKKSVPERPHPDLFIFGLPAFFKGYEPGYAKELVRRRNYFTWAILKAHTRNTAGRVTLRSADPRDVPKIEFRYFDEGNDRTGEDLESVVDGVEFARRLMERAGPITRREVLPGRDVQTREELREFVRDEAWGHHASCTCKMGPREDPMAVVDSRFRVHGVENLRIVDASVFPRIPGFFIVSAVYMISEKASDVIIADATTPIRRVARLTRRLKPTGMPRVR